MLELNPETVCFLIDKAREFHAKEAVVIPEEPTQSSGDWARQVLADHAGDASYQEFQAAVRDLEPDQQVAIVALMWLGRGDFGPDEWQNALDQAKDAWTPETADYLMAHPLLADYWTEGLAQFGHRCDR